MHNHSSFDAQIALGAYCRTGENAPHSSHTENIHQYRKLVFSAMEDALTRAFPITIELIGEEKWQNLVSQFIAHHKCGSPQVWRLPHEMYKYVEEQDTELEKTYPFIKELMHYEWLEIEVFMMEDEATLSFTLDGNLFTDKWVPNPELRILSLAYPIHLKSVKNIHIEDKGQYFVTIHRDYYSKQVKFNDLSYPFVELLLKINETNAQFEDLEKILSIYESDKELITEKIHQFTTFAIQNNLVLGYQKYN